MDPLRCTLEQKRAHYLSGNWEQGSMYAHLNQFLWNYNGRLPNKTEMLLRRTRRKVYEEELEIHRKLLLGKLVKDEEWYNSYMTALAPIMAYLKNEDVSEPVNNPCFTYFGREFVVFVEHILGKREHRQWVGYCKPPMSMRIENSEALWNRNSGQVFFGLEEAWPS